jgi:hypothetical protein
MRGLRLAVLGLTVLLVGGCSLLDIRLESGTAPLNREERQLRFDTRALAEEYFRALDDGMDSLKAWQTFDPILIERALVWQIQSSAAIQLAAYQTIPVAALLDSWAHLARVDAFCASDAAAAWFGEEGANAVCDAIPGLRAQARELAATFLPADTLEPAIRFIDEFAAAHPVEPGDFRARAAFSEARATPGLEDLGSDFNPGSFPDALSDLSDRVGLVSTRGVGRLGAQAELAGVRLAGESEKMVLALEDVRQTAARIREVIAENPEIARRTAAAFRSELEPLLVQLEAASDRALAQLAVERQALVEALNVEVQRFSATVERERAAILVEARAMADDFNARWTDWADRLVSRLLLFVLLGLAGLLVVLFGPLWVGMRIGRALERKSSQAGAARS